MSKIFYRISNNRELIFLYLNNNIWNTEKFGQKFRDSHTTSWRTNTKKIKICNTLLKLRFPKTNFREKSSDIQFAFNIQYPIKSTGNVKKKKTRGNLSPKVAKTMTKTWSQTKKMREKTINIYKTSEKLKFR